MEDNEVGQIQFSTHYTGRYSYVDSARMALQGGCRWIQLRMKDASDEEFITLAKQVRQLCTEYDATFIIDDRVELVHVVQADGVHLGKNDMTIDEARQLLGPDCIIGGTANTFDDVTAHADNGADYIGCGPFRFTTTKQNLSPILGIEGYQQIISQMQAHHINLPVVAIGGIEFDDMQPILATGESDIALSGTVRRANNPVQEMERIVAHVSE